MKDYQIRKCGLLANERDGCKAQLVRSFVGGLQVSDTGERTLDAPPAALRVSIEQQVFKASMESWFFNRAMNKGRDDSGPRKYFLAGHENEAKILKHLLPIIQIRYEEAVINKVRTYGLVLRETGIVVSPDAIMDLKLTSSSASKLCVVKCETKIVSNI